jgi:hypothetical protein
MMEGKLTRIGQVGLVPLDLVRDVLLAAGEVLHILGHDRFSAGRIHCSLFV